MTPKPTAFNTTDIKPCWVPCIKLSIDSKLTCINVLFISFWSTTALLPFTVWFIRSSFCVPPKKTKVIQDWKNMKWSKWHVQVQWTELIWAVFTHTHTHLEWSQRGGQHSFIYFYIERLSFILSLSPFFQVTYYVHPPVEASVALRPSLPVMRQWRKWASECVEV